MESPILGEGVGRNVVRLYSLPSCGIRIGHRTQWRIAMTQGRWRIAVVLGPIVLMVSTGSQVPSCRAGEPAEGTWTGSL
jgi:hypothetical protein